MAFEDLHLVKLDFYVTEKLSLIRTDYSTLRYGSEIIWQVDEQLEKNVEFSNKKKKMFFFLIKQEKWSKSLDAFHMLAKIL